MKRLTFLIVALCLLQVNVNAQTLEEVVTTSYPGTPYLYIPKEFTKKQESMLFTYTAEEGIRTFYLVNDDFSIGKELQIIENDSKPLIGLYYYNFGQGTYIDSRLYFTQTFFNDDDKLEYITRIRIEGEDYNRYEVVNEDNEVLFTINGSGIELMHYNDRCYLAVEDYHNDQFVIYAINKNGGESSISKVKTLPGLSASPVFANRNSVVDVTIDEAAAANGGELVIVDNSGRVVAKQQFEPGQTTVPVQTNRMRTGVYNITFNNGEKIDNARIIVK